MANDELINSWAAARMLRCTANDLFEAQKTHRGPKFELYIGKVRYRKSVLEDFIAKKLPPDAFYIGSMVLSEPSAYAMDEIGHWHRKITKIEAKARKKSRYFTETKCENGHVSERYVRNDKCIHCIEDAKLLKFQREQEEIARRLERFRAGYKVDWPD